MTSEYEVQIHYVQPVHSHSDSCAVDKEVLILWSSTRIFRVFHSVSLECVCARKTDSFQRSFRLSETSFNVNHKDLLFKQTIIHTHVCILDVFTQKYFMAGIISIFIVL